MKERWDHAVLLDSLKLHVGELSLLEAHPPLVGLSCIAGIDLLEKTHTKNWRMASASCEEAGLET